MIFSNLKSAVIGISQKLLDQGTVVNSKSWQGIASPDDTLELLFQQFVSPIPPLLSAVEELVKPNMPWAVMHLSERLAGLPLNPGETYKLWPFYNSMRQSNDKFRTEQEKFTHTYMERIWPKFAGMAESYNPEYTGNFNSWEAKMGIRYPYGDLDDVINLLARDPYTRQAYLPIWFPEDTGAVPGRVPCTLGYLFILRNDMLHISYHIRSCDAIRHFRDDIYLACGTLSHVLGQLRGRDSWWENISIGNLSMSIDSFHIFQRDREALIYSLKKLDKS